MKKQVLYLIGALFVTLLSGVAGGIVGSRMTLKSEKVHIVSAGGQGNTPGSAGSGTIEELGEDAAKAIALKDADVTEADARNLRIIKEYDDGRVVYDIEFSSSNGTYSYEIDRITGEIVSYDFLEQRQGRSGQNDNAVPITLEEAKTIALSKTNVNENDVSFTRTELEEEDGRPVYQINFMVNDLEYEVQIDALNGTLIGFDIETPSE